MRNKIVAGNWKMNKTPKEALALIEELKPLVKDADADVVFCVPAIDIIPAVEATKGTNIAIYCNYHTKERKKISLKSK